MYHSLTQIKCNKVDKDLPESVFIMEIASAQKTKMYLQRTFLTKKVFKNMHSKHEF